MNNDYATEEYTLNRFIENNMIFNIPIYQRLYVWKKPQVETLCLDIINAFQESKENNEKPFYLGTIVTTKNSYIDLIDGQQRLTTLWLLCFQLNKMWKNDNDKVQGLHNFIEDNSTMRVVFGKRKYVTEFFHDLRNTENINHLSPPTTDIERLLEALVTIKDCFQIFCEKKRKEFISYLLNNVKILCTNIPPDVDLNDLFEKLNNRGVQLQHHELIKAAMIKLIDNEEHQKLYGHIWSACSNLDVYFEEALYYQFSSSTYGDFLKGHLENQKININDIQEKLKLPKSDIDKEQTLLDIFSEDLSDNEPKDNGNKSDNGNEDENNIGKVGSPFSFPMILLHTLRIYLHKNKKEDIEKFKDKQLIEIFKKSFFTPKPSSDEVIEFINCLYQARWALDIFVVKWIGHDKTFGISTLDSTMNGPTYVRRRTLESSSKNLEVLQAMLYHSQEFITQYWLTPLLSYTLKLFEEDTEIKGNYEKLVRYLELLDYYLMNYKDNSDKTMQAKTWDLLSQDFIPNSLGVEKDGKWFIDKISQAQGISTPHYYFYKLEYILWKQINNNNYEESSIKKSLRESFGNYTIVSKNSVEHVFPQSAHKNCGFLDIFGNLALLSVGQNSTYSNKSYGMKRLIFMENVKKERIDSLKLAFLYFSSDETDIEDPDLATSHCENHYKELTGCIEKYFKQLGESVK